MQIHTATPVTETMLCYYLKIRSGFEKCQVPSEKIIIALRLHVDESLCDIFFDGNAVILSVLSTHPRPLKVAQDPVGALFFDWSEQHCFWLKQKTSNCKPGLLSLSAYGDDTGWPPTQTYSIVLSPEETGYPTHSEEHVSVQTHIVCTCIHRETKGQVVLLPPATRGCRQCAPITPGFSSGSL